MRQTKNAFKNGSVNILVKINVLGPPFRFKTASILLGTLAFGCSKHLGEQTCGCRHSYSIMYQTTESPESVQMCSYADVFFFFLYIAANLRVKTFWHLVREMVNTKKKIIQKPQQRKNNRSQLTLCPSYPRLGNVGPCDAVTAGISLPWKQPQQRNQ